MKYSHRLFSVLIMLGMVLGLFSTPAFSNAALAQEENPPAGNVKWELGFTRPGGEQAGELEELSDMIGGLSAMGVTTELSADQVRLAGNNNLDGLRAMVFDNISPLDFLGGPAEMTVYLPESGEITLELQARITAGYRWEVVAADGIEASEPKFEQYYLGMGAPSLETIHIKGPAGAAVQLVYHRPFEPQQTAQAYLNVWMPSGAETLALSDPTPPELITMEEINQARSKPVDASVWPQLKEGGGLPTSFDWRTEGIVPPVRNQGGCGSCWSFGTASIMESAIAKADGPLNDLSEQFLISCNTTPSYNRWDCGGGLTAHKYHYNTKGIKQTAIGAVLEADKPYTATNGTCTVAYDHPYKLSSWKFVTGSEWTMPTNEQLKSAIYTYGPITAGVCADSGWDSYTGGVYDPSSLECYDEEYGYSYTNHQIVLVGWDDATETWILRNSWGPDWGDNGYMHIKYDPSGTKSRVGEGTSWVVFSYPIPTKPALLSPAANTQTNNTKPELGWKPGLGDTTYEVQISTLSSFEGAPILDAGTSTSYIPVDALSEGKWYWHVRGKNLTGTFGAWSSARYFIVDTYAPDVPQLKSPSTGTVVLGMPNFTWYKPATATRFEFAYNATGIADVFDYTSGELKTTSHKPYSMPMAQQSWFVRAKDPAGNWSDWSLPSTITVEPRAPGIPIPLTPKNKFETNLATPTLTWKGGLYGHRHYVQIATDPLFSNLVGGSTPLDGDGVAGTSFVTDALPNGKYYWRVMAKNEKGEYGRWSAKREFTVFSGFDSQFNGDATGWTKVSGGDWYVDSSQYYTDGKTYGWTTARQAGNASDFTYEAMVDQSSVGRSRGLMVRANSSFSSGYLFVQTKYYDYGWYYVYSVWKLVGGRETALQYWTESSALVDGWNKLKVVADGSNLSFYINDILVWSGSDTKFTRGLIGLRMFRWYNMERMNVDWATLSLSGPLAIAPMGAVETVEPGQNEVPYDPNYTYGPEGIYKK